MDEIRPDARFLQRGEAPREALVLRPREGLLRLVALGEVPEHAGEPEPGQAGQRAAPSRHGAPREAEAVHARVHLHVDPHRSSKPRADPGQRLRDPDVADARLDAEPDHPLQFVRQPFPEQQDRRADAGVPQRGRLAQREHGQQIRAVGERDLGSAHGTDAVRVVLRDVQQPRAGRQIGADQAEVLRERREIDLDPGGPGRSPGRSGVGGVGVHPFPGGQSDLPTSVRW